MRSKRKNEPVELDINAEVAAMNRMTVGELRERYAEVFGEPSRSGNKTHLVRRIAWRIQAQREGGLSDRAKARAAELAREADLRLGPPRVQSGNAGSASPGDDARGQTLELRLARGSSAAREGLPMNGAMLRREYRGRTIAVRVLPKGFEYEGDVYRSLSAIAKEVTGSHWNGRLFFGLTDGQRKEKSA